MNLINNLFGNDLSIILPIVINLILLESILSVDNAAVLATMVMDVDKKDRKKALTYGILGAYFFRGLFLVFASVLYKITWLKALGALYLIWLFIGHFKKYFKNQAYGTRIYYLIKFISISLFVLFDPHKSIEVIIFKVILALYGLSLLFSIFSSVSLNTSTNNTSQDNNQESKQIDKNSNLIYKFTVKYIGSFSATVILIEIMDLAFSLDNVFAAVAFTDKLGLICLGVGIGIISMRLVANIFVSLLEKFKFLGDIAFAVIGLLGLKLLVSYGCEIISSCSFCELVQGEKFDLGVSVLTVLMFVLPVLISLCLKKYSKK